MEGQLLLVVVVVGLVVGILIGSFQVSRGGLTSNVWPWNVELAYVGIGTFIVITQVFDVKFAKESVIFIASANLAYHAVMAIGKMQLSSASGAIHTV